MNLPKEYIESMKELLKERWEDYQDSFLEETVAGLRVNTLKITPEEFLRISPFLLESIPWTKNGFYYGTEYQPSKHPYYYAGLYYIQEPSAMVPASLLPIDPGEKVLDLCAAPGGKSTELAAKLKGKGVLVSNDISSSRAKGLLKNIELQGITNAVVLSEEPDKLVPYFSGYFDKVLVDAPCSGEGMFRKDPAMIRSWEDRGVGYYCSIQRQILASAADMVRPGGMLLYSTCTFSPKENEEIINDFLEQHGDFHVIPVDVYKDFEGGRPDWVKNGQKELESCVRVWPFKVKGEGHFAALLQKSEEDCPKVQKSFENKPVLLLEETKEFLSWIKESMDSKSVVKHQDKLYVYPKDMVSLKGLRVLRTGLYLGEEKKNRFEPSQALAMALKKGDFIHEIHWTKDDPRVIKYLKGETITIEEEHKGWQLIFVDEFPLGWGKASSGRLKNKYYSGWRWM